MRRLVVFVVSLVAIAGVALAACAADVSKQARDYPYPWNKRLGHEQAEQQPLPPTPGYRGNWYQPPPDKQHPYVPRPQKRFTPLGGDSRGPVIILPGGNGPQ